MIFVIKLSQGFLNYFEIQRQTFPVLPSLIFLQQLLQYIKILVIKQLLEQPSMHNNSYAQLQDSHQGMTTKQTSYFVNRQTYLDPFSDNEQNYDNKQAPTNWQKSKPKQRIGGEDYKSGSFNIEQMCQQKQPVVENERDISSSSICLEVMEQILSKCEIAFLRKKKEEVISPIYQQFCQAFTNLVQNISIQESIQNYSRILVKYLNQQLFFTHFVENSYLCILMHKIKEHKYSSDIIKPVFRCLQYLLKGLGPDSKQQANCRQEQFIYLLLMINRQGFMREKYKFAESEDWAYYVHLLKLIIKIINQSDSESARRKEKQKMESIRKKENQGEEQAEDETQEESEQKYSKYLSLFFNKRDSQFPLVLKLMAFYRWPDFIIQTNVKLCILQISNHQNRRLQKYFLNFPFVTIYILYCQKISDGIEKYLSKGESDQCEIAEQIFSDLKFLEDFLKAPPQPNKKGNIKQLYMNSYLNMYVNAFAYFIIRIFYQYFSKYISQSNSKGLINLILLLIQVVQINTVFKIRLGFQEMLHKYINCQFFNYVREKPQRLDQNYSIFDQCPQVIKQHSQTLFFSQNYCPQSTSLASSIPNRLIYSTQTIEVNQVSRPTKLQSILGGSSSVKKDAPYSSVFKKMSSYIPKTNSNWLHYEMRKISQALGIEVQLNKQIEHSKSYELKDNPYLKNSFSYIIDKIQQNKFNGNKLVLQTKRSLLSRFSSPIKHNPIFNGILTLANRNGKHVNAKGENKKIFQDNSEQLIYYFIVLLCSLNDNKKNSFQNQYKLNLEELYEFLKYSEKCRSLMLVGIIYWYVKLVNYRISYQNSDFQMMGEDQSNMTMFNRKQSSEKQNNKNEENSKRIVQQLLFLYQSTLSKLTYFVLTEGWQSLIKNVHQIKKMIWNKQTEVDGYLYSSCHRNESTSFSNDIFRDIQCQIVYFVVLRFIFGTSNSILELKGSLDENIGDKDVLSKQIKVPCRLNSAEGERVFLIMDGQYIRFTTMQDQPITKQPLQVKFFNVYYEEREQKMSGKGIRNKVGGRQYQKKAVFELVDNSYKQAYTVYFQQIPIREYIGKQIKWRKSVAASIEMSLRTMRFDIQN